MPSNPIREEPRSIGLRRAIPIAMALSALLGGCVMPLRDKRILDFTPDGETLVYCTQDKLFVGSPVGMNLLGFGPSTLYLEWCDVDAPQRPRRLRLDTRMVTFPPASQAIRDSPSFPEFSPDSQHVALDLANHVVLVDLRKGTKRRIAPHLRWVGAAKWLSKNELIFETSDGVRPGQVHPTRWYLYRWNIHRPTREVERVYECRGEHLKWSLSPDRSRLLLGSGCDLTQCKVMDLATGAVRAFGPAKVRLDTSVWARDGSVLFCELVHPPADAGSDGGTGDSQYVLLDFADTKLTVANHRRPAPSELEWFLDFTPDGRHLVTSSCRLIDPRTWTITDLKPRVAARWKQHTSWKPEFHRFPIPGWFEMQGPDGKAYAVDCYARRFVPLPERCTTVTLDGKRFARLTWSGEACTIHVDWLEMTGHTAN